MRLLKDHKAFSVSPFVLRSIMQGQYWPEGDRRYHTQIVAPTLLIYGFYDHFVTIDDGIEMARVSSDQREPLIAFNPGSEYCHNSIFTVTRMKKKKIEPYKCISKCVDITFRFNNYL